MTLNAKEKFEKKQARLWKALGWVVLAFVISFMAIGIGAMGNQPFAIAGILGVVFSFIALFVVIGELEI
jgi:uncharacterized membrane protein